MNPRPTILVADPAAHTAALIARHLDAAGYRPVSVASGADALAAIDERHPSACVLEVMLGDRLTGYELVRQLRALPETASTPILLMSARAGKLDRDFAFTVGANDYFKKPFRVGELIARLETLVTPAPRRIVARRTRACAPRRGALLAAR
jgi:DNA-binding response OmpR family regulator